MFVEFRGDQLAAGVFAVITLTSLHWVCLMRFFQKLFIQLAKAFVELSFNRSRFWSQNLLTAFKHALQVSKERIIGTDLGQVE